MLYRERSKLDESSSTLSFSHHDALFPSISSPYIPIYTSVPLRAYALSLLPPHSLSILRWNRFLNSYSCSRFSIISAYAPAYSSRQDRHSLEPIVALLFDSLHTYLQLGVYYDTSLTDRSFDSDERLDLLEIASRYILYSLHNFVRGLRRLTARTYISYVQLSVRNDFGYVFSSIYPLLSKTVLSICYI